MVVDVGFSHGDNNGFAEHIGPAKLNTGTDGDDLGIEKINKNNITAYDVVAVSGVNSSWGAELIGVDRFVDDGFALKILFVSHGGKANNFSGEQSFNIFAPFGRSVISGAENGPSKIDIKGIFHFASWGV